MKRFLRARRFVPAIALPLLAASLPVGAAAVRHARPHATAPQWNAASTAIIALPLNPVVPAAQRTCTAPRTASGLGHVTLRPGSGAKPTGSDVALVNYIGYLAATGAVFDQGMNAPLPVDGVIPGFAEGLQTMAKGEIARFCIPAAIGYGAQGSGPIPANADLVFQVELLDHRTAADVATMRKAQAADPPAP